MGAPHSSDAAMHCSTVMTSLIVDLYSRIRPHPVHVRLQACRGSSIMTIGNFLVPRNRWVATYFARFAVIFSGYLIHSPKCVVPQTPGAAPATRRTGRPCLSCFGIARARTKENNFGTDGISDKRRTGTRCR